VSIHEISFSRFGDPMAVIRSILICGRDLSLLESRKWVLETCGYRVLLKGDTTGWLPVGQGQNFDLLILCHTLSAMEREQILMLASHRWPLIKTLILFNGTQVVHPQMRSNVFNTQDGPAMFLSAVRLATHPGLTPHGSTQVH
jgi:hypothetical protein